MATWEHQLLSRIIRTGDINSVLQWGISQEDFQSSEGRMLFNHLVNYYQMPGTAGSVLGPHAVHQQYPLFQPIEDPSMSTDALCKEVRENRVRTEMRVLMQNAEQLIQADPAGALNLIHGKATFLQQLGTSKKSDVHAIDAMHRIMHKYELKEQGVDMSICPFPWEPFQEATGGLEAEDYIVIYGRPKSMKSWVLAYLICWCYEMGKRVLIYTKEMTPDNIIMRVAALMSGIRYHEFRRGRLSPIEKASLYETWNLLHHLREIQSMVVLSGMDAGDGGDTIPWLSSKVDEYKPDVGFIDGMYLMSNARAGRRAQKDNERVRDISRDLRQMILKKGTPFINTLQANREAAKNHDANLDEIAFSDAIGMDATIAWRVINEKHQPTIAHIIGGSREFALDGFRTYGIPATNFEYAGPLTAVEVQQAKDADVGDAAAQKRAAKKASSGRKQEDKSPEQMGADYAAALNAMAKQFGT
jgi:replicative DNA helicase